VILYLDTSAIVKKYFKEDFSEKVITLWKEARAIVTSSVAYAETMASFHRKKREAPVKEKLFERVANAFRRDWQTFICVETNNDLNELIDHLVGHYALRGFDAIHLASALVVYGRLPEDFLFVSFDQRLIQAARAEDLNTFPSDLRNP
jgi:predicted nucleic acid-binding protein